MNKVKTFEEMERLNAIFAEVEAEEKHRNIVASISRRLENAEKSATEQNNHHYYKMFADAVKTLLEKI